MSSCRICLWIGCIGTDSDADHARPVIRVSHQKLATSIRRLIHCDHALEHSFSRCGFESCVIDSLWLFFSRLVFGVPGFSLWGWHNIVLLTDRTKHAWKIKKTAEILIIFEYAPSNVNVLLKHDSVHDKSMRVLSFFLFLSYHVSIMSKSKLWWIFLILTIFFSILRKSYVNKDYCNLITSLN